MPHCVLTRCPARRVIPDLPSAAQRRSSGSSGDDLNQQLRDGRLRGDYLAAAFLGAERGPSQVFQLGNLPAHQVHGRG